MTMAHPLTTLRATAAADAGAPRVIWCTDAGRIELSAASLWNYAVKAANLLTDEWALPTSASVHLKLPAHWQSVGLILGCWLAGVSLTDSDDADVVIARDDSDAADRADAVTALDAWGRASARDLAASVVDLGRELRAQPDILLNPVRLDVTQIAVRTAHTTHTMLDVLNETKNLPTRVALMCDPNAHDYPATLPMLAAHAAAGNTLIIGTPATRETVADNEQPDVWI